MIEQSQITNADPNYQSDQSKPKRKTRHNIVMSPDEMEQYELYLKAAKNNLKYDPVNFVIEASIHLEIQNNNPEFISPWIDALLDNEKGIDADEMLAEIEQYRQLFSQYHDQNTGNPSHDQNTGNPSHDQITGNPSCVIMEDGFDELLDGTDNSDGVRLEQHIIDMFAKLNLHIQNNICVICRTNTDNFIQNSCASNCAYYCHDVCAGRWILSRFGNPHPYCMVCGREHNMNDLPNVITDAGFVQVVQMMILNNTMSQADMGEQFMNYIAFRGIPMGHLIPEPIMPESHNIDHGTMDSYIASRIV